jgi:hypothetical protein
VWIQGGTLLVADMLFCGNGANINSGWTDGGGNTLQGPCGGGSASTLRVPSEYATIQSAIDASFDGDVVEVGPGLYAESINLGGREITVRSTHGASETVVDPLNGRCFSATGQKGASAQLQGFTLRGGSGQYGGGVYITQSSPTLVDCVITANTATYGGGLYVSNGSPRLVGCTLSLNVSSYSGGGAYIDSNASVEMVNCSIVGNTSQNGSGGGVSLGSGTLTMHGGEVRSNQSGGSGGGLSGGVLILNGCSVIANWTQNGGNGGGISNATVTIDGGAVSGNGSSGQGGGLYGVNGLIDGCEIVGNTAVSHGGGLLTGSSLQIRQCTLEGNESGGNGGAWYMQGGTSSLTQGEVRGNSASAVGGVWIQGGTLLVADMLFCGNGANFQGVWTNGGGVVQLAECADFCPADISNDGRVDSVDLSEVLVGWGQCVGYDCAADIDRDGAIGPRDLAILLATWGECP